MPNEDHNMTAQALAEAAAASMLSRDNATAAMGIALAEVGPGHARMTMTVRADMLNGHQTCCLLYTSPSPRDQRGSRMPSSA